jgi:predicted  nucleic acid-binding Zn-ribbon protein
MDSDHLASNPASPRRRRLNRQTFVWAALAVSLLVNVVVAAGLIALTTSSTAARSIAPRLRLATVQQVRTARSAANAAAATADDAAEAASDIESRVSDLETGSGTSDLQSSVDDLESRVSDLESGFGSSDLQSNIDDLDSRVSDLESRADDVENAVSSACDAIEELSTSLQDVSGVYVTC